MRKYTIPQNMTVEYLLSDQLGSTSLTTDASGAKVSEIRYKAWGEIRASWTSSPSTTPAYRSPAYTFTGQFSYMDDPTTTGTTEGFGLMFYNARWYDGSLGRFAQADTIIPAGVQGYDRYAYVNNNPVKYTDPNGHDPTKNNCDYAGVGCRPSPGTTVPPTLTPTSTPCPYLACKPTATPTVTPLPSPTSTPASRQDACRCSPGPQLRHDGTVLGISFTYVDGVQTSKVESVAYEVVNANDDGSWELFQTHSYGAEVGEALPVPVIYIGPTWGITTASDNAGPSESDSFQILLLQLTYAHSPGDSGSFTIGFGGLGLSYSHTYNDTEPLFP